jgi:hypothetical protein
MQYHTIGANFNVPRSICLGCYIYFSFFGRLFLFPTKAISIRRASKIGTKVPLMGHNIMFIGLTQSVIFAQPDSAKITKPIKSPTQVRQP